MAPPGGPNGHHPAGNRQVRHRARLRKPRAFELIRHTDVSGVSGTGAVAEGCLFTDGSVALRWHGTNPSTAVWPDLDSIIAVHGHGGATVVHWLDDAEQARRSRHPALATA